MVLTVDIGNTSITVGLYGPDGQLQCTAALDTAPGRTRDGCAVDLVNVLRLRGAEPRDVDGAILSCVVPPLEAAMAGALELLTGRRPLIVGPGIRTGLNIRSDLHNQLGSDIVAASVAALARYPSPCIVVDLGTATTFSLLKDGVYEGCAILPGVRLGLEALARGTAELPHISLAPPPGVLGRNTVDAMRAGILFGAAGAVDGLIDRFEAACGSPAAAVVATGGCAPPVLPHCRRTLIHDPNLLLDGLYLLYRKNAKPAEKHRKA